MMLVVSPPAWMLELVHVGRALEMLVSNSWYSEITEHRQLWECCVARDLLDEARQEIFLVDIFPFLFGQTQSFANSGSSELSQGVRFGRDRDKGIVFPKVIKPWHLCVLRLA